MKHQLTCYVCYFFEFNTKDHGSNALQQPLILLGYLKDIHYVKVQSESYLNLCIICWILLIKPKWGIVGTYGFSLTKYIVYAPTKWVNEVNV